MKAGSWWSIGLIYVYGVIGAAEISRALPIQGDFMRALHASPEGFALFVSLLTVPTALLSTVAGGLIDRIGAREALGVSCAIGAVANFCYLFTGTVFGFEVIRVFEGFSLIGFFAGAPALIMATTSGRRRMSAMAVWSTYTPVGFSLGLVMGGMFAGGSNWKYGFLIHAVIFILCSAAAFLLPRPPQVARKPAGTFAAGLADILSGYTQIGPLRVSLAFGLMAFVGLGTSTVFPSLFANAHGVSLVRASNILAAANFANLAGGLGVGILLARGMPVRPLFIALATIGSASGIGLYLPGTSAVFGIVMLCVWLVACGAGASAVLAVLPAVVPAPEKGAAAAGLLSQIAAATSIVTPIIFLMIEAHGQWGLLAGLAVLGWMASVLMIPTAEPRMDTSAMSPTG
ncbi:MAG: MFS transporter [Alphaproteobacteria bacterium]|nr:MFS transporter [Alphaproteobacteria bacterium]